MAWNYQRDESTGFNPIPVGDHRIRIESAEKAVSKSGKDMLTLKFQVSGQSGKLFHYIVFLPDRPEITNRNLTQFFDAFPGIQDGNFNTQSWVGQVGACHVKHEDYNGSPSAKVQYFIKAEKQSGLPAWVEPENGSEAMMGAASGPSVNVPAGVDEEVPF